MMQVEERELRFKNSGETLQELCDSIRKVSVSIMGNPDGEEQEEGVERIFKEIIADIS